MKNKAHKQDGTSNHAFVVHERQGPLSELGETVRFSAVQISWNEFDERQEETLGRFPTHAEANDCAKKAKEDLKCNS